MSNYVRQYRKSLPVRETALAIIQSVPGHKNFWGQVCALTNWVKAHIQYVQDIRGVETVQTPVKTLDYGAGDCDDQATLVSCLLESVGFHTRFKAIKTDPFGDFVHVYCEVNLGTRWIPLETTEPWEPGRGPPQIAGAMIEDI